MLPELLDPDCDWVAHHAWSRYTELLEQGCDACLLIGQHARAGTPDGVMCHTDIVANYVLTIKMPRNLPRRHREY